jgi:adenine-specific DNA-methyltransferase
MAINEQAVRQIKDERTLLEFFERELHWPLPQNPVMDDVTFEWTAADLRLSTSTRERLGDGSIKQLRPMTGHQPWGIFFLQLGSPRLYLSELRKILRALEPMRRKLKEYPTWKPSDVLFVCTHDWKSYTFAHFEGENSQTAKISTFGWEYQSPFVRTLCEFNIPKLCYPEDQDMFGLDPRAWVAQWSSAFDVKPVTEKFYKEYDAVFKSIKKLLAKQFNVSAKVYEKRGADWTEKDEQADRPVHLFVQNLVNRLMFLKFLEKRRWLDYNPNYLADLYKRAISGNQNYYRSYLFYIFFGGLNHQLLDFKFQPGWEGTARNDKFVDRIGILPFLNGGLFEKEAIDESIEIPNRVLKELFDLFSRYNFTIQEDTPLDVEVAVNPEMLGKVFEESVIARKEKGAYYTPRTIVSFMCREALKNHLAGQLKIQDEKTRKEKVDMLVDEHSAQHLDEHDCLEVYRALHDIKVLDPAVGSGAFVVGMMLELLEVYKAIGQKLEKDHPYIVKNKLANPQEVYELKKQIIQNSLYGVDIEEFAINIARLRFWLSLAVDFPIDFSTREEFIERVHEIEPLPNLLYKLRCGDSLLAKYHGVSLEPHGRLASGEYARGRKNRIKESITDIACLKKEFYAEGDSEKKKMLQREIESGLRQLVVSEIDVEIKALEEEVAQVNLFQAPKAENKEREKTEKEIGQLKSARDKLSGTAGLPSDFPVIWDVEFGEVMAERGFDVVIGNPPYVSYYGNRGKQLDPETRECYVEIYESVQKQNDRINSMNLFAEKGLVLLKQGGHLSFITNKTISVLPSYVPIRKYIINNSRIDYLATNLDPFEQIVDCVVLGLTKSKPNYDYELRLYSGNVEKAEVVRANKIQENRLHEFHFPKFEDILKKIETADSTLKDLIEINRGVNIGGCFEFFLSPTKKSNQYFKYLSGTHCIKRYSYEWNELIDGYFIFDEKKEDELRRKGETLVLGDHKRFLDNKLFIPESGQCLMCAYSEERIYSAYGLMVATHHLVDTDLKYACALINSKLMTFYAIQREVLRKGNKATPHVGVKGLKSIPIYLGNKDTQRRLIKAVGEILASKKKNPSADTSQIEREIDEIVYQIYGLTEEEIAIVEGASK